MAIKYDTLLGKPRLDDELNVDSARIFADAAARDLALPAPSEGARCTVASELQEYRSGVWTTLTALLKGLPGADGTDGVDGADGLNGNATLLEVAELPLAASADPNTIYQLTTDDTFFKLNAAGSALVQLGSGGGADFAVNVELLTETKTLTEDDVEYQFLQTDSTSVIRYIRLPASPSKSLKFIISNTGSLSLRAPLRIYVGDDTVALDYLNARDMCTFCYNFETGYWCSVDTGIRKLRTAENSFIDVDANTVVLGRSSTATLEGTGVGVSADGASHGASFGYLSSATSYGTSIGTKSQGRYYGASVGYQANSNSYGAAVGCNASASFHGAAVGYNAVGGDYGIAIGEYANSNGNKYGFAAGLYSQVERFGGHAISGDHLSASKLHREEVLWTGQTTDATETELYLHGVASNRCDILASSVVGYDLLLTAIDTAFNTYSVKIEGVVKRDASGNTTLVGTPALTVLADEFAGTLGVAVSADDVNDALIVKVTGLAATTIRWGARAVLVDTRI
jgi:hypothetical protein